eukprot:1583168-Karenia_brevis.AAC.1
MSATWDVRIALRDSRFAVRDSRLAVWNSRFAFLDPRVNPDSHPGRPWPPSTNFGDSCPQVEIRSSQFEIRAS